jgi:probable F420-dependent oxidoreductase
MTRSPVHVGLILALTIRGLAVDSYDGLRRVARAAESLGVDSVWLCDHFLTLAPAAYARDAGIGAGAAGERATVETSMPLLECWTALSALSRDTDRVRLGTSVLCVSYRYPAVLAKMAATLDVISGGRLDLGLGAGWFEREYRAYGIPFPPIGVRIAQLDEALEVIRRMWSQPFPAFAGAHYTIDGAVCDPLPVQRPHPPIWVGGEGDRVHQVAARAADGVNVRWWSPARVAARRAFLDAACHVAGRDPATLARSVTVLCVPGRSRPEVDAVRARFAAVPADGHVAGTPDECVARLREYLAAGVRHFLFTIPDVTRMDGLELLGREVLPAIRHEAAAGGGGRGLWPKT